MILAGVITLGFTAFFEPIAAEFGWSYTQISVAASIRGVEAGLLSPLMGILIDRWGPRRLVFGGTVMVGLAMIFLSGVDSLAMFYVGFAAIAFGISGTSPTVVMTTMANWFRKRMGLVSGIIGSGFAIGGLLIPLVVLFIDNFGWRTALIGLGILIMVICLPLSLLLRHEPEPYGYLPDGEKNPQTTDSQGRVKDRAPEVSIGRKQALLSRTFWHLGLAMTFSYFALVSITTHIMPYFDSIGMPRATAGLLATGAPLISIAGRVASGWLGDKYNVKVVTTVFFLVLALGMVCFIFATGEAIWMIIPAIILYGIGWGGNFTLRAPLLREYFGRGNYGFIFGIMIGLVTLGGIAGPLFAGWIYDTFASYRLAWIAFAVLVFVSTIIIATTPPVNNSSVIDPCETR